MIKTKFDIGLDTIEHINHISDVHIRLYKRHTEYEFVFERLKELIKNNEPNTINCVSGDIAHAKTEMSPELITMLYKFFTLLADNAPTFVILGNHDCNLNNSHRMDVLDPIISIMKHPNLYFLKQSGIYTVADTDIFVYSVLDSPTEWPAANLGTSVKKVCMYHGVINSSLLDNGVEIIKESIPISMFNGFDAVLAGDLHRQQDVQEYSLEEKEIEECELEEYLLDGWEFKK